MDTQKKAIRLPQVKTMTGLSKSSIYQKVDSGDFPKPFALGERAIAWVEAEVQGWITDRIAQRDAKAA